MPLVRTQGTDSIPGDRALLSVRDLRQLTGLDDQTLYRHLRANRLPGVRRIGGRVFVVRTTFERWLDESSPPLRAGRRS